MNSAGFTAAESWVMFSTIWASVTRLDMVGSGRGLRVGIDLASVRDVAPHEEGTHEGCIAGVGAFSAQQIGNGPDEGGKIRVSHELFGIPKEPADVSHESRRTF